MFKGYSPYFRKKGFYVYFLRDPRNNQIRYSGQTTDWPLKVRLRSHLNVSPERTDYNAKWIRKANKTPKVLKNKIIIDQLGNVYRSVSEAAKAGNLSYSGVNSVLRGERYQANGYIFKYVETKDNLLAINKQLPQIEGE